jgi:hypothetical protein
MPSSAPAAAIWSTSAPSRPAAPSRSNANTASDSTPATRRYQLEKKTRSPAGSATFVPVRDLPGAHGELDPRLEARLEPTPPSPSDSSELSDSSDPSDPKDPSAPPRLPQILAFRPDGTADPVTIVLRDREGFGLALRINPITARIRVTALDRP